MKRSLLLLLCISLALCMPESLAAVGEYLQGMKERVKECIQSKYNLIKDKQNLSEMYKKYSTGIGEYIRERVTQTKRAVEEFKDKKILPRVEQVKEQIRKSKEKKEEKEEKTVEEPSKETQDPDEYIKEIQKFLDQFMEQLHQQEEKEGLEPAPEEEKIPEDESTPPEEHFPEHEHIPREDL